jgi:DNA-binding protein Fis
MEALNLTGGNRSRAAKLLGLSRPTLLAKVEKYEIRSDIVLDVDPSY